MTSAFRRYLNRHNYPTFDLKAVLFDMDGVLYNSMPAHEKSWQQVAHEWNLQTSPHEFFLHEGRTGKSTINMLFNRTFGRDATDDEIVRVYERKTELFTTYDNGKTMEGAREVLERVQSYGLTPVLVTGSGQASLLNRLNDNFPGFFTSETMVTALDVKMGKPHPEPFLMGLQKGSNLVPNQALVVENAPMGVQAAHSAGIFTIAVNTGPLDDSILKDAGADMILKSMTDLLSKLPEILTITHNIKL